MGETTLHPRPSEADYYYLVEWIHPDTGESIRQEICRTAREAYDLAFPEPPVDKLNTAVTRHLKNPEN